MNKERVEMENERENVVQKLTDKERIVCHLRHKIKTMKSVFSSLLCCSLPQIN
jgi:hypothetical protein